MFLLRTHAAGAISHSGGAEAAASAWAAAISALDPDSTVHHRCYHDGVVLWAGARARGAIIDFGAAGSWLAALGTPSLNGSPIRPRITDIAAWRVRAERRGLVDLAACEGLYAFVLRETAGGVVAMMDRSGMAPLYYAEDRAGAWLSSSATAIACVRECELDPDALACLCLVGYPLRERSLFAGVSRLDAGELAHVEGGRVRIERWWQPPAVDESIRSPREAADRWFEAGAESARSRLKGAARVVGTLTAGLDSRCLAAIASASVANIDYFTGPSDDAFELPTAAAVAQALDVGWRALTRSKFGVEEWRGLIEQTALASDGENQPLRGTSKWCRVAGADAVVLFGLGGEAFRDYWSGHERVRWLLRGRDRLERLLNYRCAGESGLLALLDPSLAADARERVLALLRECDEEHREFDELDRLDRMYVRERMRRWASLHVRACDRIVTVDLPLFTQAAIELALSLPRRVRRGGQIPRWLVHDHAGAASRVPLNEGYCAAPASQRGLAARCRDLALDLRKIGRKLARRQTSSRQAPRRPTWRETFGELLDPAAMRISAWMRPGAVDELISAEADRPLGVSTLGAAIGLEVVLRAAAAGRVAALRGGADVARR